jgi:hypothetical protein
MYTDIKIEIEMGIEFERELHGACICTSIQGE